MESDLTSIRTRIDTVRSKRIPDVMFEIARSRCLYAIRPQV